MKSRSNFNSSAPSFFIVSTISKPRKSSPSSETQSASPMWSMSSSTSISLSPISTSWTRNIFVALLIAAMCCSSISEACFIRNCPRGGKRSMDVLATPQKPCMRCGPGNSGQCVGPQICCSPHFGCHFGTPETAVCQKENESITPCAVVGDTCGSRDSGKCVSANICCDSESCAFNDHCKPAEAIKDKNPEKEKILNLLKRLLQSKN